MIFLYYRQSLKRDSLPYIFHRPKDNHVKTLNMKFYCPTCHNHKFQNNLIPTLQLTFFFKPNATLNYHGSLGDATNELKDIIWIKNFSS